MHLRGNSSTVVAFDLDDTLYKEVDFVRSAYAHICRSLIDPREFTQAMEAMWNDYQCKADVLLRFKSRFDLSIDVMELVQMYREHFPSLELSIGAKDLLVRLRDSGAKLALITDGRELTQTNKLRALAVEHFFRPIVISEVFGSEKPDDRNYKFIEDTYPSCEYVYVGDNIMKDFITPNLRGWTTIGLRDDGRNIHSQSIDVPLVKLPQHFIASLDEIVVSR